MTPLFESFLFQNIKKKAPGIFANNIPIRNVKYIAAYGAIIPDKSVQILANSTSPTPNPPGVIGIADNTFPKTPAIAEIRG